MFQMVVHRRLERPLGGFALVELLAIIGIVGIVVSLILPSVMAARASARRTQCSDHLRQIGIAAATYHSALGAFPFTTIGGGPQSSAIMRSISPHAQLLPYLELESVFAKINFSEPGSRVGGRPSSVVNADLLTIPVPVFLCPDDTNLAGATNYRANMGVIPGPGLLIGSSIPGLPTEKSTGAFRVHRSLGSASFTDGLSNTAMFSEKLIGARRVDQFDPPRDCFLTTFQIETVDDAWLVCQNPPSANPPHDPYGGTTWLFGGFDQTWYNHLLPPNSRVPDCASNHPGGHGAYTARSFHVGGINAVFADGSVHKISENLELAVWRAIATRAGGEGIITDF